MKHFQSTHTLAPSMAPPAWETPSDWPARRKPPVAWRATPGNPTLPHAKCQEHPCQGRIMARSARDCGVRVRAPGPPNMQLEAWNQTWIRSSSVHAAMRLDPSLIWWQGVPGGNGRDEANRTEAQTTRAVLQSGTPVWYAGNRPSFPGRACFDTGQNKTEYEVHMCLPYISADQRVMLQGHYPAISE